MEPVLNVDCKTPANIADTLSRTICVQKTNTSTFRLIILGILAGVYIGFGLVWLLWLGTMPLNI